jgi:hypothetical protein
MSSAASVYKYFTGLRFSGPLPRGVEAMVSYRDPKVRARFKSFAEKYYAANTKRVLILGINPSRFGAGITGVSFTDPKALEEILGIANDLPKKRELSSTFVYQFVEAYGGPKKFYDDFLLSAALPLGLTKDGLNYNFYDDPETERALTPFIVKSLKAHIKLAGRNDMAIVLGTGKLLSFMRKINEKHGLFGELVALEHPRFIMQYRRKHIPSYIRKYVLTLKNTKKPNKIRPSK